MGRDKEEACATVLPTKPPSPHTPMMLPQSLMRRPAQHALQACPWRMSRAGRRKIEIKYIDDKSRRHITFSKRKAGIMKKAYELSTLTGTQVLLLVASETGHVYTFATPKLQPLITKQEGKNLIQTCLNAPDPHSSEYVHAPPLFIHVLESCRKLSR